RQARVFLAAPEFESHAALRHAVLLDELSDWFVEPQLLVLEVDGVNRVAGHGHVERALGHDFLAVESDDRGGAPPGRALTGPIEVDEEHRTGPPRVVHHAGL